MAGGWRPLAASQLPGAPLGTAGRRSSQPRTSKGPCLPQVRPPRPLPSPPQPWRWEGRAGGLHSLDLGREDRGGCVGKAAPGLSQGQSRAFSHTRPRAHPVPVPRSPGESTTPCRRALLGCWGSGACAGLGASVGNAVLAMSGDRGDALGAEREGKSSWAHRDTSRPSVRRHHVATKHGLLSCLAGPAPPEDRRRLPWTHLPPQRARGPARPSPGVSVPEPGAGWERAPWVPMADL